MVIRKTGISPICFAAVAVGLGLVGGSGLSAANGTGVGAWPGTCFRQDHGDSGAAETTVSPEGDDPLTREGKLNTVAPAAISFLGVHWEDGRLGIDIPVDPNDVQQKFRAINQMNSSSWGGETWQMESNRNEMRIRAKREPSTGDKFAVRFDMEESAGLRRQATLVAETDGYLQVTLTDPTIGYLLRLTQASNGRFTVYELRGIDVFAGSSQDYDSFCQEHRQFAESRLVPAVAHFGIADLFSPFDGAVREAFVLALTPLEPAETEILDSMMEGLAASTFEERQAALEQLKIENETQRQLLWRTLFGKRFSPEVRARVRTLLREKADDSELKRMDFLEKVFRESNPAFVATLLTMETDPGRRDLLARHLASIGGRPEDGEPAQPLALEATNPNALTEQRDERIAEQGPLREVTDSISDLVALGWQADQLSVDRDHWAEAFSGRPIADLVAEAEAAIESAGLPESWFVAGGQYDLNSVHYPQLLFERLAADATRTDKQPFRRQVAHYGVRNSSLNRQLETSTMAGQMRFMDEDRIHRGNGDPISLDDKPFYFEIEEKEAPGRRLFVEQQVDGTLRVLVSGGESDYVVQLFCQEQRAYVQDVMDGDVFVAQADSFRQLLDENNDYFRQSLLPLLQALGVRLSDELTTGNGGPAGAD